MTQPINYIFTFKFKTKMEDNNSNIAVNYGPLTVDKVEASTFDASNEPD